MWSCVNICIAVNELVLNAIEERQAAQLAAAKTNASKLAAFVVRELFKDGDEPGMPCKRIQFMTGEWPAELPAGGYVEDSLVRATTTWIKEYEDTKETHEN